MTKLGVAVDVVLFTIRNRQMQLLLIKRLAKPYVGRYALPGGFVLEHESLDAAAIRELRPDVSFAPDPARRGELPPDRDWRSDGGAPAVRLGVCRKVLSLHSPCGNCYHWLTVRTKPCSQSWQANQQNFTPFAVFKLPGINDFRGVQRFSVAI